MLSSNDALNILTKSAIFGGLPKDALEAIACAVQYVDAPRHGVITEEGDPGDGFYIIISGDVRLYRGNEEGTEIDVSILGPNEIFGEMSLLTGEPRSTSAQALEETRLMFLPRNDFEHISARFPELSRVLVKELRSRVLSDEARMAIAAEKAVKASQLSAFHLLFVIGISVLLAILFNYANPNGIPLFPEYPDADLFATISPAVAMKEVERGEAAIVDAMPISFYEYRHIKGAANIPLGLFDILYMMTLAEEDKGKRIIVYGGTISRPYDLEVADKLILRGHEDVRILEGGLEAWEKMGYPLEEKAKK